MNLQRPRALRLASLALLLGAVAFALGGCEAIMVATGQRMRLDGIPLQSITASLNGATALAPGGHAPLSIVATTTDGRTLATAGTGDGKVLADSYRFASSVATVSADGVVSLPADPRQVEASTPHVRITAAGTTAPVAELDIPVRYDVAFAASFAGLDGMSGMDGTDGFPGTGGTTGSFDPNSPSAGGDGGNGSNGSDGSAGGNGDPGPDVDVWIALEAGPHPLLRIRARARGHDQFFLVDPQGGSLAIAVRGGSGGRGGNGGHGGPGGPGGSGGSGSGSSGSPGRNGQDGMAGDGGPAGKVTFLTDPAAAPYLDRIQVTNRDGDNRPGPAPTVTIAPVASPW